MNLPKDFKKHVYNNIKGFLIVGLAYYAVTWFTGCPFRFFFGISCPGCGMTRAWLSVLRLDFSSAFACHPLFLLAPLVIAAIIFGEWIDFHKYRWLVILITILFFAVYFIRLFLFPDSIVNLNFKQGIFYRTLSWIFSIFTNY